MKPLGKRRGDDRHGVDLLGVAAAGEVVDRRVQTEQDRAVGVEGAEALGDLVADVASNRNVSMIGQNRQRQNIQGARPQSDWIFSEKSPDCGFCLGTIPKIRK